MLVQIVLFDDFDPLDAVAPFEVLHAAGQMSEGRLRVELVSAEGIRDVPAGIDGLFLHATAQLDPDRADVVIVPGAAGRVGAPDDEPTQDMIAVRLAATVSTGLPALLDKALGNVDVVVATVCGGSLVLSMAGLIEGRHAVTHHLGMELLGATGTSVVDARVVDDGNLVTAAGVTSGLDLGLHLVERLLGPRVAIAVERLFAYERRGIVWRNAGLEPLPL